MKKSARNNKSKLSRFREIESVLQDAGWVGLRVAGVARAISVTKSYAHQLLVQMVDEGLIERRIEYTNSDTFFVNYCYYQLELWDETHHPENQVFSEMDSGISHMGHALEWSEE